MQTPAGTGYELKLAYALFLDAAIVAAAYRFARRRFGGDAITATFHALLGWFFVQYAAVGVTGLCGILNSTSLAVAGLLMAAALWVGAGRTAAELPRDDETPAPDRFLTWGCFLFLAGYAWAVLDFYWPIPPVGDDDLTYHLPAAVRWLQAGRFVLHETWYFNPANTYSPLAGSMFAAWWVAPFDNDVFARFAQAPALALVFFGVVELCRRVGVPAAVGAPVALAAALSRPFASQIVFAKDDLYLAGFFVAALASLHVDGLKRRGGVWPLGVSVGLFLATKVTALLAAPIFLLALDALVRARLRARDWVVLVALVLAIAGPWFIRNAILTGNPVYPTRVGPLEGMFSPATSERLRSVPGFVGVVTRSYFALPLAALVVVMLGWGAAVGRRFRGAKDRPLMRAVLVGPVVGFVVFALAAPFAEVRFLNPTYALLFAAFAVGCAALPIPTAGRMGLALVIVVLCASTSFPTGRPVMFGAFGLVGAAVGVGLVAACRRWPRRSARVLAGTAAVAAVGVFLLAYVTLDANVNAYFVTTEYSWKQPRYAREALAESWAFVRNETPRDGTVAYANTHFTYPLFGFDHRRRVVYAPVRPGVRRLHDLPTIPGRVPGESLREIVVRNMNEGADRETWLANLGRLGATHLYVQKGGDALPPEIGFARSLPERFERVFENEAAVVWRIRR